jgi:hypothetical protein
MKPVHLFHIPVMGTGYTVDSPARVAPFGIDSVVSLVDDLLLDQVRLHYAKDMGREATPIGRSVKDGRALRVQAYMDLLQEIVDQRFGAIRDAAWSDPLKRQYFRMLPTDSLLRQDWLRSEQMADGAEREALRATLVARMVPGRIDANIMVKLDRPTYEGSEKLPEYYTDGKTALRGFANSTVDGSLVFSAGINQPLFTYMAELPQFRRDENGYLKKRIIIKVSDFRSAMIQGTFLARKGLEVSEYRIESGLNCGGHAFASQGELLPVLLDEFSRRRQELAEKHRPGIEKWYRNAGLPVPAQVGEHMPRVTVQGGIGNWGEMKRVLDFGFEGTGWGSPFLLVPEATPVDPATMELLRASTEDDLYLSDVSPLGVPFNNLRGSGSERDKRARIDSGTPGSACPKGFLSTSLEFSDRLVCTSSRFFQKKKIEQISATAELTAEQKATAVAAAMEKSCICDHLGNSALIALGEAEEHNSPQSVCPGPNIAWFNKIYSLEQMVDHIYGRGESLVPTHRPHMYATEIRMYVDYLRKILEKGTHERTYTEPFAKALAEGIAFCHQLAESTTPNVGENLESLKAWSKSEATRLREVVAASILGPELLAPA